MFRPHLCITHRGERKVEQVAVKYSRGHYEPFDSVLSTATVIGHGESSFIGKSKYIRAWVYNTFGFVARRCQVFVENIWLDHRLIEAERTPLHWADLDDVYVFPAMHQGHKYGHYIDICASDSIEPTLQIISQKAKKGYHRFKESGIYRIELSAEADRPCRAGHLMLTVRHDGNWNNLHVISARESRPFIHWSNRF
jgi:hypothetical protein